MGFHTAQRGQASSKLLHWFKKEKGMGGGWGTAINHENKWVFPVQRSQNFILPTRAVTSVPNIEVMLFPEVIKYK